MLDRGFTVKTIDELVEACKNDPDFDVDHWTYNEKAKALWIYNAKDQQTVIMLKVDDNGFMVKSVW
ncbi:MAG: hypothetical protein IJF95_06280 [Erysipelotrichaceae bacterium]|jgi:hypothetical protein|nr:hypothetical protein [Erysipelotrichaceae bacterium]